VKRIAIIGHEEGLAGQITSWLEMDLKLLVTCYVNPDDRPLNIDSKAARSRPASQFDVPTSDQYKGLPLINSSDFAKELNFMKISSVVLAISDPKQRSAVFQYLASESQLEVLNCIHPSAVILADVLWGRGIIVEPLCYIGYRAEIGNGVILKAGSQVDHHSVVRDFCTLDPGVVVAGNSLIGEFSQLHTNCTVINRINIADHTTIGAGAVVVKNISESNKTLVGVPAKPLAN
jgi:UDP-N-acetylbacillosamine N-acetyltransferase